MILQKIDTHHYLLCFWNTLSIYLSYVQHSKAKDFQGIPIEMLNMPWRTEHNNTDCGVFTMRHMETFMGLKYFDPGLKQESIGQDGQLNKLRVKYLNKIVRSDYNIHKSKLISQASSFQQLPSNLHNQILKDAADSIHARLKQLS